MSYIRKYRKGNKVYLAEVESRRIKGKVVQRFLRYVGKQADGHTILSTSISDAQVEEVKLYGPLLVLHHLAEEIGLREHLGPYANEILSMVYAHCIDYRSVNHMRTWFARTDLQWMLNLEQLTEDRLLRAMDFFESDGEQLQRAIFQSVKQRYRLQNSGVIYDVTNTYLYGKKCPLGKLGHDKEGVAGRPLIQIGLGVTLEEGIPVFHKTFDGNIGDSRTLHDLITTFRGYELASGTIDLRAQCCGNESLKVGDHWWGSAHTGGAKVMATGAVEGLAPALCGSRAIEPNYFLCHDAPLSAQPSLGHLIPVLQPPAASRSAGLAS